MIRCAFEMISDIPTRLFCFSTIWTGCARSPKRAEEAMLRENLQEPLTSVPDPFGEYPSFGAHNNAMLRRFLDTFGFEYEFMSATEFYKSGQFDPTLLLAAERYDAIMEIMLAILREGTPADLIPASCRSPETGRALRPDQACRCQRTAPSPSDDGPGGNGPRCRSPAVM